MEPYDNPILDPSWRSLTMSGKRERLWIRARADAAISEKSGSEYRNTREFLSFCLCADIGQGTMALSPYRACLTFLTWQESGPRGPLRASLLATLNTRSTPLVRRRSYASSFASINVTACPWTASASCNVATVCGPSNSAVRSSGPCRSMARVTPLYTKAIFTATSLG